MKREEGLLSTNIVRKNVYSLPFISMDSYRRKLW